VHARTTAQEILRDFPEGIDVMITGVGTGGHITACAEVCKRAWPALRVLAVEPSKSPVISGGTHSPHKLQGIGAGFIPANLHVQGARRRRAGGRGRGVRDGAPRGARGGDLHRRVERRLAGRGGEDAAHARSAARVLTFCYDTGDRYLSWRGCSRCRDARAPSRGARVAFAPRDV
jgi:cysteine synthase A